jgi:hypothetical protein
VYLCVFMDQVQGATISLYSIRVFDVITSLVSMEHGVYGCEKVTSLGEVTSNGLA